MKDVEKLIGGYVTGTLTDQERDALFAEALQNQALFDALADEEALRDLLADPVARRQLLATLEQRRESLWERVGGRLLRPLPMTVAAGVAAAALAVVVIPRITRGPQQQVAVVREVPQPEPAASAQPVPEADHPQQSPPAKALSSTPSARNEASAKHRAPASGVGGAPSPLADTLAKAEQKEELARPLRARAAAEPGPPTPAAESAAPRAPAAPPAPLRAAKVSLAPTTPFEYVLERQGAGGLWSGIEATAPLEVKDQVRIAIQARTPGWIAVMLRMPDGSTRSLFAGTAPSGARINVPEQGGLPATRGDLAVSIVHSTQGPVALGLQTGQAFRQSADAEGRAQRTASAVEEAAASREVPYRVEIPLRFR